MPRNHTNIVLLLLSLGFISCVSFAAAQLADETKNDNESVNTVANTPIRDIYSDTWVGVDGLGRPMPIGGVDCPLPKEDRTVAIFYFLWLGGHSKTGPWDITKITAANPVDPQWGPPGHFHHWAEPELGYYMLPDEFVYRRHMQQLTDAGVDVLSFDVTNGFTYQKMFRPLCDTLDKLRSEGNATPRVTFLMNSSYERVVAELYRDFYAKNDYSNHWFRWGEENRPLLMANPAGHSDEISQFFNFRRSWAWTGKDWYGDGRDRWPWLEHYPQKGGWHESPEVLEQMVVAVAEHPISNIGRSYHAGQEPESQDRDTDRGLFFQEQWNRALEADPQLVFLTGWNEWVAQRFVIKEGGHNRMLGEKLPIGDSYFVDAYNAEFSRDIEPMRGGHSDNYYYQLLANIRRYKGARPIPTPSEPKTIQIDGCFADWTDVLPEFRDTIGDVMHRDSPGWGDAGPYIDQSGRKDIITAKVARDEENLYFMVETTEPITSAPTEGCTILLLNTDCDYTNGWQGYDYIVNWKYDRDVTATFLPMGPDGPVNNSVGLPNQQKVGDRQLELSIPKSLLGIAQPEFTVDFHWLDIDVSQLPGKKLTWDNPIEILTHGDHAPNRRLNYRYQVNPSINSQEGKD